MKQCCAVLITFALTASQTYAKTPTDKRYTTLGGEQIQLSKIIGTKPVYLKFWASWCVPCNKQMPHFEQAYQHFSDDIAFVSVNIDVNDDLSSVKDMLNKHQLSMPTIRDVSGELSQAYNLIGTPLHVLLNKQGQVVHRGHKADEKLDHRLRMLASNNHQLSALTDTKTKTQELPLNINEKGVSALFFTATWCDWYLAKTRPKQSQNCIVGQQQFNQLLDTFELFNGTGILSRLWTGEKELADYRDKYAIKAPLVIDQSNATFVKYKVKKLPTLLIFKNGRQTLRIDDFSSPQVVIDKVQSQMP